MCEGYCCIPPSSASGSRGTEHEYRALAPAEGGEKTKQLLPREIFFVEQSHSVRSLFACYDLRPRIHPLAEHVAAHVARRDLHPRVISHAFHFSRNADRVNIEFRIVRIETRRRIRSKPHRSFHAITTLLECLETQVLVPGKRRKAHRIAPAITLFRNSHSLRAIYTRHKHKDRPAKAERRFHPVASMSFCILVCLHFNDQLSFRVS